MKLRDICGNMKYGLNFMDKFKSEEMENSLKCIFKS
jgi:hypothetical protein